MKISMARFARCASLVKYVIVILLFDNLSFKIDRYK